MRSVLSIDFGNGDKLIANCFVWASQHW